MSAHSQGGGDNDRLVHWIVQGFSEEHAQHVAKAESLLNRTLDLDATTVLLNECQTQYRLAEGGVKPTKNSDPPAGDMGQLLVRATTLKEAWDALREEHWRHQAEFYLRGQAVAPTVARDYARACMQLDCKLISPDEMRNEQKAVGDKITAAIRTLERSDQDQGVPGEDRLLWVCRLNLQLAVLKARHRAATHGLSAHLRQIEINSRRGEGPTLG